MADDLERWLTQRPVRAVPDSTSYRLRRFVGRHRLGVAAAVAAVLALSLGLATTLWQFRVAQAERARAERRFNDVRQLASTVIFDLHDAIAPLPGSTDARRLLIQRALTYVDGLAAEASGDLPLQRELARAYERLADVQGRPGNANLGDRDGARSSLEKSLGVMDGLIRDPRATTEDRIALARLYNQRALLEVDPDAKRRRIAAGLSLLDGLSATEQQGRAVVVQRASLVWAYGAARAAVKDLAGARDKYGEAVGLFAKLFETSEEKEHANSSRNLSIAHKSYGAALWETGDRTGALDQYQRAETLDRERVRGDPDNTTWQLDLSFSLASLAFGELRSNRNDDGVRHYQQSLELRQAVLNADPLNDQAQDAVARGHETLAQALNQTGDRPAALAAGLKAVEWRDRRWSARPGDPALRDQLINSLSTVYNVRLDMAQAAGRGAARQQWEQARATIGRIAQLQEEAIRGGAKTTAGFDHAGVLREIEKCDAALARR